jgi:hypothetical protein
MTGSRSVSQFVRAAGAEIRKRLLREPIEPAGFGVPLDGLIETRGLEILKPRTKSHQLVRRQFGYCSFDFFQRAHGRAVIILGLARHYGEAAPLQSGVSRAQCSMSSS